LKIQWFSKTNNLSIFVLLQGEETVHFETVICHGNMMVPHYTQGPELQWKIIVPEWFIEILHSQDIVLETVNERPTTIRSHIQPNQPSVFNNEEEFWRFVKVANQK
jgi:hypothetical protein